MIILAGQVVSKVIHAKSSNVFDLQIPNLLNAYALCDTHNKNVFIVLNMLRFSEEIQIK